MESRQRAGRETLDRLLKWGRGPTDAERMVGRILNLESFNFVEPIHPKGGPDGKQDLRAYHDGRLHVVACHFPAGQQLLEAIISKFNEDFEGVARNGAQGFVFCTNQDLSKTERQSLRDSVKPIPVHFFVQEGIGAILDSPKGYGIRHDFLDIAMSDAEQKSYFDWMATRNELALVEALKEQNQYLTNLITGGQSFPTANFGLSSRDAPIFSPTYKTIGDFPLFDLVVQILIETSRGRMTFVDNLIIPVLYPDQDYYSPTKHVDVPWTDLVGIQTRFLARNGQFVQTTKFKLYGKDDKGRLPAEDLVFRAQGREPQQKLTQIWFRRMRFNEDDQLVVTTPTDHTAMQSDEIPQYW